MTEAPTILYDIDEEVFIPAIETVARIRMWKGDGRSVYYLTEYWLDGKLISEWLNSDQIRKETPCPHPSK